MEGDSCIIFRFVVDGACRLTTAGVVEAADYKGIQNLAARANWRSRCSPKFTMQYFIGEADTICAAYKPNIHVLLGVCDSN